MAEEEAEAASRLAGAAGRVSKRQRRAFDAAEGAVDALLEGVVRARAALAAGEDAGGAVAGARGAAAAARKGSVSAAASELKQLAAAVQALGRAVDEELEEGMDEACLPGRMDRSLLARLLAGHCRREGRVELARQVEAEAGLETSAEEERAFVEMRAVVASLRERDAGPCLQWAERPQPRLPPDAVSGLAFQLHRLRYLQLVEAGDQLAAVAYLRAHISPFAAAGRMADVRRLAGCLVFRRAGGHAPGGGKERESKEEDEEDEERDEEDDDDYDIGGRSPYSSFFGPGKWAEAERHFCRLACQSVGLSQQSPLLACLAAGCDALPAMLRYVQLMQRRGGWRPADLSATLPFDIDMDRRLQYHSSFVCPVTRELCLPGNPPVLLRCGHVISRESAARIAASSRSARRFKCPTCPQEQQPGDLLELSV